MVPIRNLVFEGGGVKGVAYIGAMEALDRRGTLSGIKRVGGTSAGAINACLFALGFSIDEQKALLSELPFEKFQDTRFAMTTDELLVKEKRFLPEWWGSALGFLATLGFSWGIHKGSFFESWIEEQVTKKVGKPGASFKEVFERTGIELHVCAANLTTNSVEVFSPKSTPDMSVAKAVRMSMSIPFFFQPVKMKDKAGRECVYVDGGVFRNFPIRLFDLPEFFQGECETKGLHCNPQTIGFRLDSRNEIDVMRDGHLPAAKKIDHIGQFTGAVLASLLSVQENQHLESQDFDRTVYVDTLGVGTTDFAISAEKKLALIQAGREAVDWFFEKKLAKLTEGAIIAEKLNGFTEAALKSPDA